MQNEHYILSTLTIVLIGLVFWVIRKMLDKVYIRIESVEGDLRSIYQKREDRWKEHDTYREGLLNSLLKESDHKLICRATMAETRLHISKTAQENREMLFNVIKETTDSLMAELKQLKTELKKNGKA